ncbi:MAG: DUF1732 domain-containing protein [Spirochaetales bacterium]|nr:DUF1732 domain-containing protein [Spirochaetales bacterium]
MTGSASARLSRGQDFISITLRSTNSRGLDLIISGGPPDLQKQTGEALRRFFQRGRIEASIELHGSEIPDIDVRQLSRYKKAIREAGLPAPDGLATMSWLGLPGVLRSRKESKQFALQPFLERACLLLRKSRIREGRQLLGLMQKRILELGRLKKKVVQRYRFLRAKEPERWQKLWEKTASADDRREIFEQWFEKQNIQEELDRLDLHLKEIANLLAGQKAPGRELDFFFQELLRELNTITAKLKDFTIRRQLVRMKAVTDELKEQARNLC